MLVRLKWLINTFKHPGYDMFSNDYDKIEGCIAAKAFSKSKDTSCSNFFNV